MKARTRRPAGPALALALASTLVLAAGAQAAPPAFYAVGDIPGGAFDSNAASVTDHGVVSVNVTGEEVYPPPLPGLPPLVVDAPRGAIWTAAGGLELLPDPILGAGDISSDGNLVLTDAGVYERDTATLTPFPAEFLPRAMDRAGVTVVGRLSRPDLSTVEAASWTAAGGVVGLGFLPATNPRSEAKAVSNDGSVVAGTSSNIQLAPGFTWTSATGMIPIGSLDLGPQDIRVISGLGNKVSGLSNGDAYIWDEASGFTWLGNTFNPGIAKIPSAMNIDGTVVVGGNFASSFSAAFIWDPVLGMRELASVLETEYGLDLTGWTLLSADGLSPNGRWIVGQGINPAGDKEGWVVYLGSPACGLGFEIALVLGALWPLRSRLRARRVRAAVA